MKKIAASLAMAALLALALTGCSQGASVERAVELPTDFPVPAIAPAEDAAFEPDAQEGQDATSASSSAAGSGSSTGSSSSSAPAPSGGSSAEAHEHSWTHHPAEYVEEPVYAERVVCSCGQVFSSQGDWSAHNKALALQDPESGHSYSVRDVQVGTESVLVQGAYYSCPCGATK